MPHRKLKRLSETEPARSVVLVVGVWTALSQLATLLPFIAGVAGLPNVLIVVPIAAWAIWAAANNNVKHLTRASFFMALMWLWTGLTMLLFTAHPAHLLWIPFLVVACVLGISYIYFSHLRKVGGA